MDIQQLETQYLKAKVAYYDGNPLMSDAAFDAIEEALRRAGSKVIEQVGAKRKDFDFPHPTPLKSLAKLQTESVKGVTNYQEEAFDKWLSKRKNEIDHAFRDLTIEHMRYSPKFDGSSVNIVYRNRNLESVLTRGDGKFGKDVTDRFRKHLPAYIDIDGIVEIRCEAVMRKSIFEKKYAEEFANARNIVAGIIGKDDFDVEKVADLTLMPLHLLVDGKHENFLKVHEIMDGHPIVADTIFGGKVRPIIKDYLYIVKYMEKFRETVDFQLDGIVFSLPEETREFLGENDHDPEWAIAIKFVPEEAVTSVIGVQWNLGKTGEMIPVVCLKPVQLAGTTVKRTSGYNAGHIVDNKLGEGAFVSIAKAGDIIPEIQNIINPGKLEDLPSECPSCKGKLIFDGIHLMCTNDDCIGKVEKKLGAACGMLDLKGVSGQTIKPFAKDFVNMFEVMKWVLTEGETRAIEKYDIKFGSRSHEIFVNAFKNIQSLSYAQVILMMGYDGIGRKISIQIAKEHAGLEPDFTGLERALVDKLHEPDKVLYIKEAVRTLEALGVTIDRPEVPKVDNNSFGVVLTGSPKGFGYKTKAEFLAKFPNMFECSMSDKECKYLITDDLNSTSGKMKNAAKKGIEIKTYGEF